MVCHCLGFQLRQSKSVRLLLQAQCINIRYMALWIHVAAGNTGSTCSRMQIVITFRSGNVSNWMRVIAHPKLCAKAHHHRRARCATRVPQSGAEGVQPVARRAPTPGAGGAASRLRPAPAGPGSWGAKPPGPACSLQGARRESRCALRARQGPRLDAGGDKLGRARPARRCKWRSHAAAAVAGSSVAAFPPGEPPPKAVAGAQRRARQAGPAISA